MRIDGKEIPTPRENMKIDYIEISRSERAITGRLRKEIVAIKRQFSIPYQGLSPEYATIFIDIYESGRPVLFEYEDVKGEQSAIVYITSLPREIYSPKPKYTQNITIGLEEQ